MAEKKCENGCDYAYYPNTNEEGWRCVYCDHRPGEPPGFSPQLDRDLISLKVGAILYEATDAKLVYVSNGSHADFLTAKVAHKCISEKRFDQYSILLFLLKEMTLGHAEYWQEISGSIMAGADKRDRCACGQLATISIGKARYCSDACMPVLEGAPF